MSQTPSPSDPVGNDPTADIFDATPPPPPVPPASPAQPVAADPTTQWQAPPNPLNVGSEHPASGGYATPPPPPPVPPTQPGGYATQLAPLSPEQERQWGMLAHLLPLLAMLLTAGVAGFIGSLIVYLLYKDRGPFVRANAVNSLNVQIVTGIGVVLSYILMVVLVGFVTLPIVLIWATVLHIIGATKANAGQWWEPPMTPKFIK